MVKVVLIQSYHYTNYTATLGVVFIFSLQNSKDLLRVHTIKVPLLMQACKQFFFLPDDNLLSPSTLYCWGCSPNCFPCQQIFHKTIRMSYFFYIIKIYVRNNNLLYLTSCSWNKKSFRIQDSIPAIYVFVCGRVPR